MANPPSTPSNPPDPFDDYLEALKVQQILRDKRERLCQSFDDPGTGDPLPPAHHHESLLEKVDAGIEKAKALQLAYERELELSLQEVANRAERGRALFLDVSRRIQEFKALVAEHLEELSGPERQQWNRLLSDYARVHSLWVQKLPPEECPPLHS